MTLQSIYEIKREKSKYHSLEWNGWPEALKGFDNTAWVVATLHYGVFVGRVTNDGFEWLPDAEIEDIKTTGLPEVIDDGFPDEKQIVELRIFSAEKEAYFWREGSKLKGRLRIDGTDGDEVTHMDANLYTRGVIARKLFKVLRTKEGNPIYIITRNYIGENALRQAGYVDCRFVTFNS